MKYFYFLLFSLSGFIVQAQNSPVYSVESNYTAQFGYRYFFDRIDPATGAYTQVAQLPVMGFYTNIKFINCFGNYVFLGVDSASPANTYYYRLYEVDTATGVVVRSIPTDTGSVPKLSVCQPASNAPVYYGIRQLNSGAYQLVNINAVTGISIVISTTPVLNQVVSGDNSTITFNNELWFGSGDFNNGYYFLYRVNTTTGQFTKQDSLTVSSQTNFVDLYYNCHRDTIYGFISNMGYLGGAQQIKIGASGQVIHTSNILSASGNFYTSQYTVLPDGRLYFRGINSGAYMLDTNSLAVTNHSFSSADIKLYAAPRMSCYTGCLDPNSVNDVATNAFSLYPNPVAGGTFTVKGDGEMQIEIIDLAGRVVMTASGKDEVTINSGALPAAVYGVKIISAGKTSFEKIVILE
jgi:membrane-bound inhibitor of C-type lysozyme